MSIGGDPVLRLAVAAVLGMIALTLAFMGYALLLHVGSVRTERRRRALEARWRTDLLDAATGEVGEARADSERSVDPELEVAPEDQVLFLELLTRYARALEYPERRVLEERALPYLPALHRSLEDRDAYRRAHALDLLGELGFDAAQERIVAGLADGSSLVAMVAARALARRGRAEHLPPLLAHLGSFENWSVGYLSSLLSSFGPDSAPELRWLVTDVEAPPRVRSVAAQALAAVNDLEAVDPATALLPGERDPELQADLIRLIGKLGRPDHLAHVRPLAASPAPHVRAAVVRAVSQLSDRRSSDVELVAGALDDPSPWVALQAAQGLLGLGRVEDLGRLAASSSPRAALASEVLETSA